MEFEADGGAQVVEEGGGMSKVRGGPRGECDGCKGQSKSGIQSKFQQLETSLQASSTFTDDKSVFSAQYSPSLFIFTFIYFFSHCLMLYTFSACHHPTQLAAATALNAKRCPALFELSVVSMVSAKGMECDVGRFCRRDKNICVSTRC